MIMIHRNEHHMIHHDDGSMHHHEHEHIYLSETHLRKRTVRYCPMITVPSRISRAKMVMIAPLNKSLMVETDRTVDRSSIQQNYEINGLGDRREVSGGWL
jgi:hypothetical protein